eukprot:9452955-Lingulodinium_polyedra.AAC.1
MLSLGQVAGVALLAWRCTRFAVGGQEVFKLSVEEQPYEWLAILRPEAWEACSCKWWSPCHTLQERAAAAAAPVAKPSTARRGRGRGRAAAAATAASTASLHELHGIGLVGVPDMSSSLLAAAAAKNGFRECTESTIDALIDYFGCATGASLFQKLLQL